MKTLEQVSEDLYTRIEESDRPLEDVFRQYFDEFAMRVDLNEEFETMAGVARLEKLTREEFLPAYARFNEKRSKIWENASNRNLGKYIAAGIVGLNIIEAIATKGKSMRPPIFLATVLFEAAAGVGAYYAMNLVDQYRVHLAKKNMISDMRKVDEKQQKLQEYTALQDFLGTDDAEIHMLVSQYDNPSQFWQEYGAIQSADPATEVDVQSVESEPFKVFVERHPHYPLAKRERRFEKLSIAAHTHFAKEDPAYITTLIEN